MKTFSFFKSLSWLLALNLLVKPVWIFLIDRQVQNVVGHEAYGRYFATLNLSYILFFIADAGLSNMLNQRMAYGVSVGFYYLLRIKIILLLLYAAACCAIGWLTGTEQWALLAYVICIQVLTSLFLFLRSAITARQYFTADALLSVIDKLLMILVCGAMLYEGLWGGMRLLVFLQVQAACTAIAVAAAALFLMAKGPFPSTGAEPLRNIARLVLPFAAVILLMSMQARLDGFLLERLHERGAYETGVYAAAFRLLDAGNMVGYLAASFLVPFLARHREDALQVQSAVLHTRHLLLLPAAIAVPFLLVFAPWLVQLLYHLSDGYYANVLQLCLAALPAYYFIHIYGSLLTATAKWRLFIPILAAAALLNLALNLVLIPRFGAAGCAMAALVSQYSCAAACCLAATRSLSLPLGGRSLAVYALVASGAIGVFYAGKMAVSNVWIILATAAALSGLLLATQLSFFKKYFRSLRQPPYMPDLLLVFAKRWKFMAGLTVLAIVLALVVTLLSPREYLSTATALPANSLVADKARLFNANIEALYSDFGSPDELDRMEGTAALDTLYIATAKDLGLAAHYGTGAAGQGVYKAAVKLKKQTTISRSAYGELKIRAWDEAPAMAASIANTLLLHIQQLHQHLQNESNLATLQTVRTDFTVRQLEFQKLVDTLPALTGAAAEMAAAKKNVLLGQLQQSEKMIGEYQLAVNTNPQVLLTVEGARPSLWPDRPKVLQTVLLCGFLALVFSFLLALFLESRKSRP